jgi:hypothetical protein
MERTSPNKPPYNTISERCDQVRASHLTERNYMRPDDREMIPLMINMTCKHDSFTTSFQQSIRRNGLQNSGAEVKPGKFSVPWVAPALCPYVLQAAVISVPEVVDVSGEHNHPQDYHTATRSHKKRGPTWDGDRRSTI